MARVKRPPNVGSRDLKRDKMSTSPGVRIVSPGVRIVSTPSGPQIEVFDPAPKQRRVVEVEPTSRQVEVCLIQMECVEDVDENIQTAVTLVKQIALGQGAKKIILLPELFSMRYFPQHLDESHFAKAETYEDSKLLETMCQVAKDIEVVLPVSFFEKCGNSYFNSVAVIDATGEKLGVYRKSHIPMGPGYEEKYYFTPGNTGFKVFETKFAKIGVGICWDQWFPEAARCMALQGAEILFYPTAIGSEPHDPLLHSKKHWQRVIQGHAAANMIPIVVANRIGKEEVEHFNGGTSEIDFYGCSFMCDETGEFKVEEKEGCIALLSNTFDLDAIAKQRAAWGLYRDRRPDLYKDILKM